MKPLYLDNAATTPVRDEVRAAMEPFAAETFGNPSSLHRWGRAASAALEEARATLAEALCVRPSEVRFVRGGTESDNLAIIGSCRALAAQYGEVPDAATKTRPLICVSAIEHSAVLEAAEYLEARGAADVFIADVAADGGIDLAAIEPHLTDAAAILSFMWVNNETGLILPLPEITDFAHRHGARVHTDASQAIGKIPIDLGEVPVDLLTGTGHKIYGPRGMGFLFVREGTAIDPLLYGGGQERSLRPGTEDVAGAVGLATAVRLATEEQASFAARLGGLRDHLERGLTERLDGVRVNCLEGPRAAHVSSIGLTGDFDGSSLLMALDLEGIAVSGGSACHSGAGRGSHVIAALYGADDPHATVRFSFGRTTTVDDIDRAVETTVAVVERLRATAGS